MKTILNCVAWWLSGWAVAFWLSFGDYMGKIYFDNVAFLRCGAFLAVLFSVLSLYNDLIKGGNNE